MARKITVLWGLPGSGKTHYANEVAPRRTKRSQTYVVHMDRIRVAPSKLLAEVASQVFGSVHDEHVIIDGLITTNADADKLFMEITTSPYNRKEELSFEVVWWEPDVEACLHNDRGRRTKDSAITIQNIPFEEPSEKLIKEWNLKVTKKHVVRKEDWKVWSQESGVGAESKLKSQTWSLGGTGRSCWGDEWKVSATTPPSSFQEFDELLERICPAITFLQYKKLYAETVTTDTEYESDYYGGSREYGYYVCDLPKLYEMLKELGYVTGT